jgi:hypothetical protein
MNESTHFCSAGMTVIIQPTPKRSSNMVLEIEASGISSRVLQPTYEVLIEELTLLDHREVPASFENVGR